MIAFASSFDQPGVITKSAEDARLLISNMAGYDANDQTSLLDQWEDSIPEHLQLKSMRLFVPENLLSLVTDNQVVEKFEEALTVFKDLGAKITRKPMPLLDRGVAAYHIISSAEASSNLSRYDGIRFGFRANEFEDFNDLIAASRSEGFGNEVKRRILTGTFVLSSGYFDAYYKKAMQFREQLKTEPE